MVTVGTYRCPTPSCLRPLVRRRTGGKPWYLWCQFCRQGHDIPEREKMLKAGAVELPGFETEGAK